MSASKRVLTSFDLLRKSFVRTTVRSNVAAFEADLYERIDAYNTKKTEADPAKQVKELPLLDEDQLSPVFKSFCEDGQKYFQENPKEELAEKYIKAIDDYLFMKQKISVELQIMEANRVGVDKNLANIIKNTAGHVGLQMPKVYEDDKK